MFQVENVNPQVVGDTTVYIGSAASSHMVCTESRISKHVIKPTDCDVRITGSFGTSNATKKGTLKFGIRNAQDQIIPVALDVLLVRNLGASISSVEALAKKEVKCDLLSTPPALRHGNHTFPISTAIPRMYVINIIIDDVSLGTVKIYRTKVDTHMWHRKTGHCNARALQQLADKDQWALSSIKPSTPETARYAPPEIARRAVIPRLIVLPPKHGLKSCTRTCGGSIP